jgi:hypothetical protein
VPFFFTVMLIILQEQVEFMGGHTYLETKVSVSMNEQANVLFVLGRLQVPGLIIRIKK